MTFVCEFFWSEDTLKQPLGTSNIITHTCLLGFPLSSVNLVNLYCAGAQNDIKIGTQGIICDNRNWVDPFLFWKLEVNLKRTRLELAEEVQRNASWSS